MNDFEIPNLAKGQFVPNSVLELQINEAKEKQKIKEQRIHDWLIALFGVLGGAVMGFLSSLGFWIVTH